MQTVYASATNILSWLGCGDDLISRAFDFIRQTVKAAHCSTRASANERQRLESRPRVGSGVAEDSIMVETIVDPRMLSLLSRPESVIHFFSLAYWHRVWIVQEIVLTRPESNIIVCGDEIMPFRNGQIFRNSITSANGREFSCLELLRLHAWATRSACIPRKFILYHRSNRL